MKKTLTIALIALMTVPAFAQSNVEEIEYMQSIFGMEKKALFTKLIKLEGPASDAFWSLYDQYEVERKVLGKRRIDLIMDYANNYDNMSDEKMNELVVEAQKQRNSSNKLINTYYKKIKKESGTKAAAQFYQMENFIAGALRVQSYNNIPFLGELDIDLD